MKSSFPPWKWPDARGYIALGSWFLVVFVLILIKEDHHLLNSDAFLILATAIVISGWVGGPVTWAFGSNKTGEEAADRNAGIVERQAAGPQDVEVVNDPSHAVPIREEK